MWTPLLLLFLISSVDLGTARSRQTDVSDSNLDVEPPPARLPRRFQEVSRTRRVHIENQTNFDGKVDTIRINPKEDIVGPQAYGIAKKYFESNGHVQVEKNAEKVNEYLPRVVRSIEAYGKTKEHLATNGEIERVQESPVAMGHQTRTRSETRIARSIDETAKPEVAEVSRKDSGDLEAQDAKVFRPLFVYRQQMAKRQHRGNYGYRTYRPNYYHQPYYQAY